ncbi:MAG: toprim domain-containing protein [Candidatus Peribacteraceae bacterium]|nr:toprim domain-containing protein [Candidatus Peribacteraceae bacterium]
MTPKPLDLRPLSPDALAHWTGERCVTQDFLSTLSVAETSYGGQEWIAFPVPDAQGKPLFYKLKRPHEAPEDQPKYLVHPKGYKATLYPQPYLHAHTERVVLCEGEPDALVLLSHGIDAVCSTGGAGTFKEEWLRFFPEGIEVTVCFDLDLAGRKGTDKVLRLFRKKRPDIRLSVIRLPEDLGEGGDVTDFFRRCKKEGKDSVASFFAFRVPHEPKEEKEEHRGNPFESLADRLLRLVTDENCLLFHDQFKEPHARFRIDDHFEVWKTRSKQFRRWLGQLLWEVEGEAATAETISTVLNVLEAKALFRGQLIVLENRVAWHEGAIWYDIGDRKCRAVRVTPEGWEIVEEPPILFRRFGHQEEQVVPVRGGSLALFLPFVNLADREQDVILLVYLVSCFVPGIPHPIPNLHGSQGSAKTTLARMLRRIVDPSKMEVLSFPSNAREFVQQLSHHYFAFFDNISEISESVSDLLCRAVTGEGVSKRELYTDDEDIIYTFRRCIGLNGINPAAKKPDLLDRSILLKLERIPEEKRREERLVLEEFDAIRPQILGAVFDALSAAMRLRDSVTLSKLPRMADFTRWGCAIAKASGYDQETFLAAYYANIAEQHQEAIAENPVAAALKAFMEGRKEEWMGSMSELLEELRTVAEREKIDTGAKEWPKAANILSRRLTEAKTNLVEIGIAIRTDKGAQGKRMVLIQRTTKSTATSATPPFSAEESPEASDDIGGDAFEPTQVSLLEPPPELSQEEATEDDGGDSGGISSTPQVLRDLGFFQH